MYRLNRVLLRLRSFGPDVEVLEPAFLREEFAAEARALAGLYAAA
jgi:hypothetical protein